MVKVVKDRTFKTENLKSTYQLYLIFYLYYNGSALKWNESVWEEVTNIFIDYNDKFYNRNLEKGLTMLTEISDDVLVTKNFIYDYNKLFIGPSKLLAPPYESIYRSNERLVMQEETISVRQYYKSVGLEVKQKNAFPDDHLSLELELICYLLSRAVETKKQEYIELYEMFFEEHLLKWVGEHCKDVIRFSNHFVCKGVARALQGFIEIEYETMKIRKGE